MPSISRECKWDSIHVRLRSQKDGAGHRLTECSDLAWRRLPGAIFPAKETLYAHHGCFDWMIVCWERICGCHFSLITLEKNNTILRFFLCPYGMTQARNTSWYKHLGPCPLEINGLYFISFSLLGCCFFFCDCYFWWVFLLCPVPDYFSGDVS